MKIPRHTRSRKSTFKCAKVISHPRWKNPPVYILAISSAFKILMIWVFLKWFKEHFLFRKHDLKVCRMLKAEIWIPGAPKPILSPKLAEYQRLRCRDTWWIDDKYFRDLLRPILTYMVKGTHFNSLWFGRYDNYFAISISSSFERHLFVHDLQRL